MLLEVMKEIKAIELKQMKKGNIRDFPNQVNPKDIDYNKLNISKDNLEDTLTDLEIKGYISENTLMPEYEGLIHITDAGQKFLSNTPMAISNINIGDHANIGGNAVLAGNNAIQNNNINTEELTNQLHHLIQSIENLNVDNEQKNSIKSGLMNVLKGISKNAIDIGVKEGIKLLISKNF